MHSSSLVRSNGGIRRDRYIAFNDGTVFQAYECAGLTSTLVYQYTLSAKLENLPREEERKAMPVVHEDHFR